ncbi:2TM domain-containing protein [Herbaspirillum lusitanum]|uniref:2TM domain-containing protein n=1 Tax=Herbaspirillum lusitanum TaxID=213312 RepID=A0ABW9A2E9_9BURK
MQDHQATASEACDDPAARINATRRVERMIGFYRHLAIYLVINSALVILNLRHPGAPFWSAGPLLGWGIGLLFHALSVFPRQPTRWKQRMIERELQNR